MKNMVKKIRDLEPTKNDKTIFNKQLNPIRNISFLLNAIKIQTGRNIINCPITGITYCDLSSLWRSDNIGIPTVRSPII